MPRYTSRFLWLTASFDASMLALKNDGKRNKMYSCDLNQRILIKPRGLVCRQQNAHKFREIVQKPKEIDPALYDAV